MKLALEINVSSTGDGKLQLLASEVKALDAAANSANSGGLGALRGGLAGIGPLAAAAGAAMTGLLAALGVRQVAGFLTDAVKQGFEFNAMMETSRLGIGALIGAFGEVRDESGNVLTDFNANLRVATQLQEMLKLEALKTTATYDDMIRALQEGVGPALKAGFNTEQIVQFTKMVTQAAGAIGLPMQQLGQEIRSLFMGDIGPDSRLANLLFTDIPRRKIKAYVEELQSSGRFFEEMERRMSAFATAGEMASGTFSGAFSNLKDAVQQALGEGTQGAFSESTALIRELTAQIVTFDEHGKAVFNQDFVDGINAISEALLGAASAAVEAAENMGRFVDFYKAIKEFDQQKRGVQEDSQGNVIRDIGQERADLHIDALEAEFALGEALANQERVRSEVRREQSEHEEASQRRLIAAQEARIRAEERFEEVKRSIAALDAQQLSFEETIAKVRHQREMRQQARANRTDPQLRAQQEVEMYGDIISPDLRARAYGGDTLRGRRNATGSSEDDKAAKAAAAKAAREEAARLREAERLWNEIVREAERLQKIEEERQRTSAALILSTREEREILEVQQQINSALTEQDRARLALRARMLEIAARERQALAQISQQMQENKITPEAAAEAEFTAYQRRLTEESNAWREYQENLTTITNEESEKRREIEEKNLQEWREKVEDFSQTFKEITRSAIQTAFDGGDFGDVLDGFFGVFSAKWQETLAAFADGWINTLSSWAMGEAPQEGPRAGQAPSAGQQRGARYGFAALQAGAALYGMYNQPGTSTAQNVMSGVAAGASIGSLFPGWGTIIGAVVGGLAGLFAPTEEGRNIRITSGPNGIQITGMSGEWGADKALRSINEGIATTAATMDDILYGLPIGLLEHLGTIRPDMSQLDIRGVADGQNWTEQIENFIRFTVPQTVMAAYEPVIGRALEYMGVEEGRIRELFAAAETLEPERAQEMIRSYLNLLTGLQNVFEIANTQPWSGLVEGPPDRLTRFHDDPRQITNQLGEMVRTIAVLSQGFEGLTHDEQVTRGQRILELANAYYETQIQYLLQIRQLSEEIGASIDRQIFEIQQTQRTPEQQTDALLEQQRGLFNQLRMARTPEEVARITQEIQQNAGALFDLMGRTPEAATQITDMLIGAHRLAQDQLAALAEAATQMDEIMRSTLEAILKFLRAVQGETPVPVAPGAPLPPSGDPDDPTRPGSPWRPRIDALAEAAGVGAASIAAYSQTLFDWSDRFRSANVEPMPAPQAPAITLVLNGSTAAVVEEVEMRIGNAVVNRVVRIQTKASQRRAPL